MIGFNEVMDGIEGHVHTMLSNKTCVEGVTNFMNTIKDGKLVPEPMVDVKWDGKTTLVIRIDHTDCIDLEVKE